jgi:protein-S-isoprenylcysteine O-methyltransferase Ste14
MNFHATQGLFLDGLLIFVCIRGVYQRRAARAPIEATRADTLDRSIVVLVVAGQVAIPVLYILSPWLDFANLESPRAAMPFGALVWLAGLWLFWRSHHDLGRNWSVTLEIRHSHELVTHGVYRFIRHPMYTSFIVLAIAQVLLLPNWVAGCSALVAVGILCVVRVPREEFMMCDVFGEKYRQYMRSTGSVLPRLGLRGAA